MKPLAVKSRSRAADGRWSPAAVKQLRKRNQLSQTALARIVGVGLNTVYLWEKGLTHPRAGVRARVLKLTKAGTAEVTALLRKAGLKEGMKKPGRKPGRAAGQQARRKPARGRQAR